MGTTEKYKPARNPTASAQRASHTPTRRLRLYESAEVLTRLVEDGIGLPDVLSMCCLSHLIRVHTRLSMQDFLSYFCYITLWQACERQE